MNLATRKAAPPITVGANPVARGTVLARVYRGRRKLALLLTEAGVTYGPA